MFNFWISFGFLLVSWVAALLAESFSVLNILVSGLFFGIYFLLPLFKKPWSQITFYVLPVFIFGMLFSPGFNGFIWLIYLALAIQAIGTFKGTGLFLYTGWLYLLAVLPHLFYGEWLYLLYVTLFALASGLLLYYWKQVAERKMALEKQNEEMTDQLSFLKRQLVSSEKLVRQEERNQIAREIHDSVGHRLTALLMQMEAARIQAADEETKEKFSELKKLAKVSLEDTREAVKTLKSEETAGIQAIIQLIRKLEAESQLRLTITMQPGIVSSALTNEQSVVIYRSVQEALTNVMRHSSSRQAVIEFQVIGQRNFQFQVSHPLKEKIQLKEGFGLTNMRERLTEIGGRLTIRQTEGQFTLIGQFPLEVKKDG